MIYAWNFAGKTALRLSTPGLIKLFFAPCHPLGPTTWHSRNQNKPRARFPASPHRRTPRNRYAIASSLRYSERGVSQLNIKPKLSPCDPVLVALRRLEVGEQSRREPDSPPSPYHRRTLPNRYGIAKTFRYPLRGVLRLGAPCIFRLNCLLIVERQRSEV